MPVDDGFVILPWAAGDTLVILSLLSVQEGLKLFCFLLLRFDGDVDVRDLEIHFCHEFDTGYLRDDCERLRMFPRIVYKGCVSNQRY